jgi:hypothetical protein
MVADGAPYLDSPRFHVEADAVSNNHFDEDGLVGIPEGGVATSLPVDEIVRRIEHHLRTGPPAWDPYD